MTMINDELQRSEALDFRQSFIVQAPAGSGKTELLIQRFLVLLGVVKQPEEILAITFTKKSAAEMRARIIHALQNAAENPEPETPHMKKTWHLARKVLQQDQLFKWNLLISPNRLRMQTIDSFNAGLTRQLPIVSHFGAAPEITNDPKRLYRKAVQEFLTHLEDDQAWSDAIATILLHMDNDLNKVESLLITLLAKRDQWLRHITLNMRDDDLRAKLEEQLEYVVTDTLDKLNQIFPAKYREELLYLIRYAACNLPDSDIAQFSNLTEFPDATIDNLACWLTIRNLLFTKSDDWRKKLDKDSGFPPPTFFKNSEEKNHAADMKIRAGELIAKLSQIDSLKSVFKELHDAPDIIYKETQWETLQALHAVLCVVAAQLNVTFQQHGKIDYIENSLAALTALGSDEFPTDLTLALDYQIKHILVDEFQDTSNSQYQLLKKITAGWEPNDGRTLFLVGDPMQSIYRFREAEVGIFIRTCLQGIGYVTLQPLTLSVNFRSTSTVVNWINEHFQHVLPPIDDIATGAVSYSQSFSHQDKCADQSVVTLNSFIQDENNEQATAIVKQIRQRQAENPQGTIAILVRSRTHLENIIPALKEANLVYRAIDIDPLTQRFFIQDLIALTRAMLHSADRIAWLAILRAPWCGLSLSDLLILSGQDSKIGVWERLQLFETINLSAHGKICLQRFMSVMKIKMDERERYSLRAWIESTWLLLGGPACLDQASYLEDAAAYFNLLDTLEQNGTLDTDSLDDYVKALYAAPNHQADDKLQIMTIHNAKGLEFDTVILPHLERKASNDDKQLLLWMERTRKDESASLILAPVHAVGDETDTIYEYIKHEQAIRNDYERSRLLYVAVTRAKKNLDLFFTLKEGRKIASSSLLEKLWPSIKNQIDIPEKIIDSTHMENHISYTPVQLKRLPVTWINPVKENRLAEQIAWHQKKFGFSLPDNSSRLTGTIIHQTLQQISLHGINWWQDQSMASRSVYLKTHLLRAGATEHHLNAMIENIHRQIENMLQDTRGQWILAQHSQAQSEFHLTALVDAEPKQFIIDRTFVDGNNIRWVIDYKTAMNDTTDTLEDFLIAEQAKYQTQMWYYFQAMREMDQRAVRMGLYFPAIPAWHEWNFEEEKLV